MFKFALASFLIAIAVSCFIFVLYDHSQAVKEKLDVLAIEESNNINRCGVRIEKFELRSYPESNPIVEIARDNKESHSGDNAIRINSGGNNKKHYAGMHLYLTLNSAPYLKDGVLEFWIKGGENSSIITDLNVYLKEGPNTDGLVMFSLPVKVDENWQRASIPLKKFSLVKEEKKRAQDRRFSWAIQEILFSVSTFNSEGLAELFIDDLKIINDGKAIYDLS